MPKSKVEIIVPTNDEVRKRILDFLAKRRKAARGLDALMAASSEIKKAMSNGGVGQNETVRNLDYLVQNGWVKEEIVSWSYTTPKGFQVPNEKHLFGLSDVGLKYTEGESVFDRTSIFSGINITNMGGVSVVGNNNVVRNEFVDVLRALNSLEGAIKVSGQLTDEQKLVAQADIQSAKDQLSKTNPDKTILQRAVDGLMYISAIPGLVDVFHMAKTVIEKIH